MGRTEFTRTLTETTVKPSIVKLEGGKVVTEPCEAFTVNGKIDEDKAVDLTKKKYGKKQQYVVEIVSTETTYAISVEDFMKHAHKVEPKPVTTPEGNKAE